MAEQKLISVREFMEGGYLLAVNREVLHPLGLAMIVRRDDATGDCEFMGVQDARDDTEGVAYESFDELDVARVAKIDQERNERYAPRTSALGWWVQPVELGPAEWTRTNG